MTVPLEPPPTPWEFPPPSSAGQQDVVAAGADLEPGTILGAYRQGLFPMALGPDEEVLWWSPALRGVLPLDGLKVSRSLRRSCRRYETTVNRAFDEVITACAAPDRGGAWIDDRIRFAYQQLHRLGWAHSVEAWDAEDRLAGGLYGVCTGGLFAAESMFHRATDAGKVAVWALTELVFADGDDRRLIDVQWRTDHLATLGVREIPRSDYLRRVVGAREVPLPRVWAD